MYAGFNENFRRGFLDVFRCRIWNKKNRIHSGDSKEEKTCTCTVSFRIVVCEEEVSMKISCLKTGLVSNVVSALIILAVRKFLKFQVIQCLEKVSADFPMGYWIIRIMYFVKCYDSVVRSLRKKLPKCSWDSNFRHFEERPPLLHLPGSFFSLWFDFTKIGAL